MKINVHAGHNYHVPGAGGCFSETAQNRVIRDKVIAMLRAEGHTVYDCTDNDARTANANLYAIVEKCNAHAVDLDLSIHFNCFNGSANGTEVWVHTGSSIKNIAQRMVDNVAALGFVNRGVKETTSLYVIRKTVAPALLIECCFCDSKKDAAIYDADKMAKAIVEGICGKKTVKNETPFVEVVDDSFLVRLKKNAAIREEPNKESQRIGTENQDDIFTVVETSKGGNWYRRKLGGWVAAVNCEKVKK